MKKCLFSCSLLALIAISFLPAIGIVSKHRHMVKRWETIHAQVMTLKMLKKQTDQIKKENARLKQQRSEFHPQNFMLASQRIRLLGQEQDRFASLNKNSLLAQSKEVWIRKQQCDSANNQITWNTTPSNHKDLCYLRLANPIEADNENLKEIFYLLDAHNPNAPIAFFTHWEMTKQTTPLDNQVWLINAEAISRCF